MAVVDGFLRYFHTQILPESAVGADNDRRVIIVDEKKYALHKKDKPRYSTFKLVSYAHG